MNRRNFLKAAGANAGALAISGPGVMATSRNPFVHGLME